MATYSLDQLALMYGTSKRTFERHLVKLKESNQFVKTSIGAQYNEVDALRISELLGFSLKYEKPSKNTTYNFK